MTEPLQPFTVYLARPYVPRHRCLRDPFHTMAILDVMLIGLFFFLLQSSFVLQPAVRIRLPEGPFREGVPYSPLVVVVSQEGIVFFHDERTTMEGLPAAFQKAHHERPDTPLLVEADSRVPYSTVMEITRMAQLAGIPEVALATRVPTARNEQP